MRVAAHSLSTPGTVGRGFDWAVVCEAKAMESKKSHILTVRQVKPAPRQQRHQLVAWSVMALCKQISCGQQRHIQSRHGDRCTGSERMLHLCSTSSTHPQSLCVGGAVVGCVAVSASVSVSGAWWVSQTDEWKSERRKRKRKRKRKRRRTPACEWQVR